MCLGGLICRIPYLKGVGYGKTRYPRQISVENKVALSRGCVIDNGSARSSGISVGYGVAAIFRIGQGQFGPVLSGIR